MLQNYSCGQIFHVAKIFTWENFHVEKIFDVEKFYTWQNYSGGNISHINFIHRIMKSEEIIR